MTEVNQSWEMRAGEGKSVTFTVASDLTGCTASWTLREARGSTALVTKSGVVTGGGSSTVVVTLAKADTQTLTGVYWHQCVVTDLAGADEVIAEGYVTILAAPASTKGYTMAKLVAAYMGLSFTVAQEIQCNRLIAQVEAFWDKETDWPWMTGAIADEARKVLCGRTIYVRAHPVTSISALSVRPTPFDAWTLLTADTDYVLDDATAGRILLNGCYSGYRAKVSYTPNTAAVPGDLQLAVNMLVAHLMQSAISPDTQNVQSYSVGQDLSVTFRSTAGYSMPSKAEETMGKYTNWSVG